MPTRQRRMKGEGSITKLSNGKYRVRLEVSPTPQGKRKWLTAVCKTQKEATGKLQEYQKVKDTTVLLDKQKETVKDFLEEYLEYKRTTEGLRESTLYCLRHNLSKLAEESFQDIPVQKITTEFLQDTIESWRESRGNIESTIRAKYKILKMYFEWLRQTKKIIAVNPCLEVVLRRNKGTHKHQRIRTISQEEHEKLKETMRIHWDPTGNLRGLFYAVYLLSYETGMRRGEIAGLKVKNVNLKTSSVTIENNIANINGVLIDQPPKTAAGYREIVISKGTMDILKELLTEDKEDYVFRQQRIKNKIGLPFAPTDYLKRFREYQKEAGIDRKITFHEIRHTNASLMIAKGVPVPVITERLGHSSVAVTYSTYAHALRDSKERKEAIIEA